MVGLGEVKIGMGSPNGTLDHHIHRAVVLAQRHRPTGRDGAREGCGASHREITLDPRPATSHMQFRLRIIGAHAQVARCVEIQPGRPSAVGDSETSAIGSRIIGILARIETDQPVGRRGAAWRTAVEAQHPLLAIAAGHDAQGLAGIAEDAVIALVERGVDQILEILLGGNGIADELGLEVLAGFSGGHGVEGCRRNEEE